MPEAAEARAAELVSLPRTRHTALEATMNWDEHLALWKARYDEAAARVERVEAELLRIQQERDAAAADAEDARRSEESAIRDAEDERARAEAAEQRVADLTEALRRIRGVVDAQAEDDGLWFVADSIVEAYFQQELRSLHATIENECALLAVSPESEEPNE
jgi:hypothetical protein